MAKKKQDGPNWWQMMLISAGTSFGAVYGMTGGDIQSAIAAALVAATGGKVQAHLNPDGTKAAQPYQKEGE